jgi:hypothetical protein
MEQKIGIRLLYDEFFRAYGAEIGLYCPEIRPNSRYKPTYLLSWSSGTAMFNGEETAPMNATPRTCRISSLLLGIASVILSFWMLWFFAFARIIICFTQFTRHTGQSWRSFVFAITGPSQIEYVLGCLGLAAILGGLGLWLVRAEPRGGRSTSLRVSAVRFCLGVVGSALDGIVLALLLAYRWIV